MADVQRDKIRQLFAEVKFSGPVLDIGSGPGFLEEKVKAMALDVNLSDLKKFSGPRILASGDALPFTAKSFRTVFCIDAVHLLKRPEELMRVLSTGGQLIVSLPCNRWNSEEKLERIAEKFKKMKVAKKFVVKSEQEWDAVVVFVNRTARRNSAKRR
jgi:ubiquinone/menaquinone biosynthesis C-methylase UbiE